MPSNWPVWVALVCFGAMPQLTASTSSAGESAGARSPSGVYARNDAYNPDDTDYRDQRDDSYRPGDSYRPPEGDRRDDAGRPDDDEPAPDRAPYDSGDRYERGYGAPYAPHGGGRYEEDEYGDQQAGPYRGSYSKNEILGAGHRFFGKITQGLARVVEYAFEREGRPNGYILGDDAGGAFVAGLRYGEGVLYTKYDGDHRVYWQGPSIGYDFGGEGSKAMVLVYHLREPSDIYHRFVGVQGSAYFVAGAGIQFQKYGDIVLAPIRAGIGLRLGANVGYLKYTRRPTWNPF